MNRRFLLESLLKKPRLPAEFQEVEYLQSTGTQYIDTNVVPDMHFDMEITFAPNTAPTTSSSSKMLGTSVYNNGQWGGIILSSYAMYIGGQGCWFTPGPGNTAKFFDPKISGTDKQTFQIIGNDITYCDGSTGTITKTTDSNIYGNLYLFKINTDGSIGNTGCKIYSCKLYEHDILVRDFVPCYRKADNVAGLYDLANGVFYTNAGMGTFIVGPDVWR